jgi:hypothetical protein
MKYNDKRTVMRVNEKTFWFEVLIQATEEAEFGSP